MKQKNLLIIVIVISFFRISYAQKTIEGTVLDFHTKQPLASAHLYVNDSIGTTTNEKGKYVLPFLPQEYVTISYTGFQKKTVLMMELKKQPIVELFYDSSLQEVVVTAYGSDKKIREVSGTLSFLRKRDIQKTANYTLDAILEKVPGLQINSINQYNTRISIRGSGNRSTTGSRNIKAYLNDIPLTQATGMTWLGGVGADLFNQVEVLKGPASSIYGIGTGGVIRFKTLPYYRDAFFANSSIGVSAFGTVKLSSEIVRSKENFSTKLIYQNLKTDGYRDFSENKSHLLFLQTSYKISQGEYFNFQFLRTDQESSNPGPLSKSQLLENRTQANSKFKATNSGRKQAFNRYGITHKKSFSNNFYTSLSVFGGYYNYYFRKPAFILPGAYQELGYRFTIQSKPLFKSLPTTFLIGSEYQNGNFNHNRFKNDKGVEGKNTIDTKENSIVQNYFLKSETKLNDKFNLTIGLGVNNIVYKIENFRNREQSANKSFETQLMPRIALSYFPSKTFAIHGSVSKGFSPPSFQEIRTIEGNMNSGLEPEIGTNYEIKEAGNLFSGKLRHQVSLFCYQGRNELVKQTLENSQKYYLNAGKTRRIGLESSINYMAYNDPFTFINRVETGVHFHYFNFKYLDYSKIVKDTLQNYKNNKITGISPFHLHASLDFEFAKGFYLNNTLVYNAKTPVNDENTLFNDSYTRYDLMFGYKSENFLLPKMTMKAFIGVNNLTNTDFNEFFDLNLNPGNEKYFYPAPERHLTMGVSLKYNLF